MGSFSAEVLYPAIAPMVNHFFNNGSCVQALFHPLKKQPIFVQGKNYHVLSGQKDVPYDPFSNYAIPANDVYDEEGFLVIKKSEFENVWSNIELGLTYEPRLAMLIAGVIESCLQSEQKWNTDNFLHRHLINVIDDQALANLSGVGPEYQFTLNEMNAEFVNRCNQSVQEAMRNGAPITYRMAEKLNKGWYTQEHDHILRNYIFTKEVDEHLEELNISLFRRICRYFNLVLALYDNEARDNNGWRVFTAKENKGVISIYEEGDFRTLDWQYMRSVDFILNNDSILSNK